MRNICHLNFNAEHANRKNVNSNLVDITTVFSVMLVTMSVWGKGTHVTITHDATGQAPGHMAHQNSSPPPIGQAQVTWDT